MKNLILTFVIPFTMACELIAESTISSPDDRLRIEFSDDGLTGQTLSIKQGDQVIFSSDTGWGQFSEVTWSPDSKYLAVLARGTKTTRNLHVYFFRDLVSDEVEVVPIDIPEFRLNILGRYQQIKGGRYQFDESLSWKKGPAIEFETMGSLVDGASNPDDHPENFYRFRVMISFLRDRPELVLVEPTEGDP